MKIRPVFSRPVISEKVESLLLAFHMAFPEFVFVVVVCGMSVVVLSEVNVKAD